LLDDLFSDEPCTNDVCKFRGLLGADLGVDNNLREIAQNRASTRRGSAGRSGMRDRARIGQLTNSSQFRSVWKWHEAEVPKRRLYVCFRGNSRRDSLTLSSSLRDPHRRLAATPRYVAYSS